MNTVILNVNKIGKCFAIERPLYQQVLAPFSKKKLICALKEICFEIRNGEVLGIVGPNGAGKTTLLRILVNLLDADTGTVKLLDQKLNGDCDFRSNIGYVSNDERSFFWRLTGKQNLEFFANLYGMDKALMKERIQELLKLFDLNSKANELFRNYSTGTRKKFAVIRAMLHQPAVLLLDEVTNSLDYSSAQNVKSIVKRYVLEHDNCCAVWCTHRYEEIYEICNNVLVLNQGNVKYFGSVNDYELENNTNIHEFIKKRKESIIS